MFDHIDSHGKMIQLSHVQLDHDVRYSDYQSGNIVHSFANVNIAPLSYITDRELKMRANSLAYSQYKQEKREYTRYQAKKKLLWFTTVVKCKVFVNKLKKRRLETKKLREQMEREQESELMNQASLAKEFLVINNSDSPVT